jgi:hypothetical protein
VAAYRLAAPRDLGRDGVTCGKSGGDLEYNVGLVGKAGTLSIIKSMIASY